MTHDPFVLLTSESHPNSCSYPPLIKHTLVAVENPPFIDDVPVKTSKPRSGIPSHDKNITRRLKSLSNHIQTRDWLVQSIFASWVITCHYCGAWLTWHHQHVASAFQVAFSSSSSTSSTSGEAYPSQQHQQASEDAVLEPSMSSMEAFSNTI